MERGRGRENIAYIVDKFHLRGVSGSRPMKYCRGDHIHRQFV